MVVKSPCRARLGIAAVTPTPQRVCHRNLRVVATSLAPFSRQARPWHVSRAASRPRPTCHPFTQTRGAKKVTTADLDDVPQGALQGEPLPPLKDEEPDYPPLLQQVRNNMLKFSHCVLLTRVGGFYELYFEHADEFAPLLNLKKSKRKTVKGSKKPAVPMAGFPAYQLDRYLKILVQDLSKHVAIVEEFLNEAPKRAKGEPQYNRRVARIVTPGTLIDEHFMDPWDSNYLLSIHVDPDLFQRNCAVKNNKRFSGVSSMLDLPRTEVGLAWVDLSSGDFFTQTTDMASLPSAVARIRPREITLDLALKDELAGLISILQDEGQVITFHEASINPLTLKEWIPMLENMIDDFSSAQFTPAEVTAGGTLLHYVRHQLLGSRTHLQRPIRYRAEDHMIIDKHSLRALEIKSTIRDGGFEGSLLHSLKKTVTKSGTRLLSQRLAAPSMSLSTINERLDLVEEMACHPQLRQDIAALLGQTFDSFRLVTKFTVGRGDADDLMELSKTVTITSDIMNILEKHSATRSTSFIDSEKSPSRRKCISTLLKRFDMKRPLELAQHIQDAIDEDGLSEYHRLENDEASEMADLASDVLGREAGEEDLKHMPKRVQPKPHMIAPSFKSPTDGRDDVWIMKRSASPPLSRLHQTLDDLTKAKATLENDLKRDLGAETLTLKWTPNLAHIAHVKGKDVTRVAKTYPKSVSSSKSTKSFQISEWTQLGAQLDKTRFQIRQEEQRVLGTLREGVVRNLVKLRRNASLLDELDVSCAFALLAMEKNLVRPILNTSSRHHIVGGRHPVVESGLSGQGRKFAPNDCLLENERIRLITGPNMAGKSTYLRQNAIISILAQIGCFVPADYAEIGLVDKIYSRVGSADNLYADQSTFMVEMLETAQILKDATARSFVIMDEVGRGTTPEDGIAVGYACLHHLYNINRCRALFATHFHKLTDMTGSWERLGCYCNDVQEEEDGSFSYVHKLRRGVNRESHALKVARVAGLPEDAIAIAAATLQQLKLPATTDDQPDGVGTTQVTKQPLSAAA